MKIGMVSLLFVFGCALWASALELAPLFRDGAVLQQGKAVPIWGVAGPGERVTVRFQEQNHETKAGADGRWRVHLEALAVSAEGSPLVVAAGAAEVVVDDVLVGEVWLVSGQSNMEWRVRQSRDADVEIPAAHYPLIREFDTVRKVADAPETDAGGAWRPALPEYVADFSAVAYSFARDLHQRLGVPVGIVNSTWGGTRIEAWMSAESLDAGQGKPFSLVHERWAKDLEAFPEADEEYQAVLADWQARRDAARAEGIPFNAPWPRPPHGPGHTAQPSGLFNGMVAPHAPYALAGFLWYQGESNAGRASEYEPLFRSMILDWREQFGDAELPFFWVQLASYQHFDRTEWAFLREAQTRTLALPHTGQVVTLDIGDVQDIHPRDKQSVGRRLFRLALNRVYGIETIDSGPVFARAEREEDGFRIYFEETHGRLRVPSGRGTGFELAGEDRVFHRASARVERDTVFVRSDSVDAPVAVRYGWRNAPDASLLNGAELPAVPFRTDDW